jgi:hypothetical protein
MLFEYLEVWLTEFHALKYIYGFTNTQYVHMTVHIYAKIYLLTYHLTVSISITLQ